MVTLVPLDHQPSAPAFMSPSFYSDATEEALRHWAGTHLADTRLAAAPPVKEPGVVRAFARTHGVAPVLAAQLKAASPSSPVTWWNDTDEKQVVAVEMARRKEFTGTATALFDRVEPPPIVFKGQALAHCLYDESWLRPRTDIDVLVNRDMRDSVAEVLLGQGYHRAESIDGDLILRQVGYRKKLHGVDHTWDVHWKLSNRPALADILSYEDLLRGAVEARIDDARFLVPNPVDSLLIACLHLIGHHSNEIRLIWLYDIHLLIASLAEAEQSRFLEKAKGATEAQSACHTAIALTQRYLPSHRSYDLLQGLPPNPADRSVSARSYAGRLITDGRALSREDRLRFIRQHLFPSADYMVRRFGIRHRWQLPFWYGVRIVRAVPKLFRRR